MMDGSARPAPTSSQPRTPRLDWRALFECDALDDAVRLIAAEYDFALHPYFQWMKLEPTAQAEFCRSQVPFCYAVEAFSQSLAAVLARIPRLEARLALADNVAEEHGRGNQLASHKRTFVQFLRALGATQDELHADCPVYVTAFNHALLDFCLAQPHPPGAALLGIIEYLYIAISTDIGATVDARGWAAPGSQRHYDVHKDLDVTHAEDLLMLARPSWRDPDARAQVAHALLLGAHWFWQLYRDMLPACPSGSD
ncbi:MAG: iron-containing redox enzyme family protein [Kofleriaceae bacterium]